MLTWKGVTEYFFTPNDVQIMFFKSGIHEQNDYWLITEQRGRQFSKLNKINSFANKPALRHLFSLQKIRFFYNQK